MEDAILSHVIHLDGVRFCVIHTHMDTLSDYCSTVTSQLSVSEQYSRKLWFMVINKTTSMCGLRGDVGRSALELAPEDQATGTDTAVIRLRLCAVFLIPTLREVFGTARLGFVGLKIVLREFGLGLSEV